MASWRQLEQQKLSSQQKTVTPTAINSKDKATTTSKATVTPTAINAQDKVKTTTTSSTSKSSSKPKTVVSTTQPTTNTVGTNFSNLTTPTTSKLNALYQNATTNKLNASGLANVQKNKTNAEATLENKLLGTKNKTFSDMYYTGNGVSKSINDTDPDYTTAKSSKAEYIGVNPSTLIIPNQFYEEEKPKSIYYTGKGIAKSINATDPDYTTKRSAKSYGPTNYDGNVYDEMAMKDGVYVPVDATKDSRINMYDYETLEPIKESRRQADEERLRQLEEATRRDKEERERKLNSNYSGENANWVLNKEDVQGDLGGQGGNQGGTLAGYGNDTATATSGNGGATSNGLTQESLASLLAEYQDNGDLDALYQKILDSIDAQMNTYNAQAEAQRAKEQQQNWIQYMKNVKNAPQVLARNGITGGASETTLLGLANDYQNSRNNTDYNYDNNISEFARSALGEKSDVWLKQIQAQQDARENALNRAYQKQIAAYSGSSDGGSGETFGNDTVGTTAEQIFNTTPSDYNEYLKYIQALAATGADSYYVNEYIQKYKSLIPSYQPYALERLVKNYVTG